MRQVLSVSSSRHDLAFQTESWPANDWLSGFRFLCRNDAVERPRPTLPMNLTVVVGTSRCDVPARETATGIVAPLNAARTARRAVPTSGSAHQTVTRPMAGSGHLLPFGKGEGRDEGFAGPTRCVRMAGH